MISTWKYKNICNHAFIHTYRKQAVSWQQPQERKTNLTNNFWRSFLKVRKHSKTLQVCPTKPIFSANEHKNIWKYVRFNTVELTSDFDIGEQPIKNVKSLPKFQKQTSPLITQGQPVITFLSFKKSLKLRWLKNCHPPYLYQLCAFVFPSQLVIAISEYWHACHIASWKDTQNA